MSTEPYFDITGVDPDTFPEELRPAIRAEQLAERDGTLTSAARALVAIADDPFTMDPGPRTRAAIERLRRALTAPAEPPVPEPQPLGTTLRLIAAHGCSRTTGRARCPEHPGLARVSFTGTADQWCDECRAYDALVRAGAALPCSEPMDLDEWGSPRQWCARPEGHTDDHDPAPAALAATLAPLRYAIIKVRGEIVDLTSWSWPIVERIPGGWQSGEHHYPDADVLDVRPLALAGPVDAAEADRIRAVVRDGHADCDPKTCALAHIWADDVSEILTAAGLPRPIPAESDPNESLRAEIRAGEAAYNRRIGREGIPDAATHTFGAELGEPRPCRATTSAGPECGGMINDGQCSRRFTHADRPAAASSERTPAAPACCCAAKCDQHGDCCPMCPRCTQREQGGADRG